MNYLLFLIPLLSMLLGWVLIRLVFWYVAAPVKPVHLAGFRIQGIIPAHLPALAKAAGEYASRQFETLDLDSKLTDPAHFQQVRPVIEEHIDHFLRHKLKEQMPMISMFIGDKTIQTLKEVFIKEIENLFPQVLTQFAGNLKGSLPVGDMLEKNIAGMDPERIRLAFKEKTGAAANKAAWAGAFIGLLVGILQLAIALISR